MKLKMNGGKNKGYTIVEVMIVLAITGFMFVIAAVFINGKQGQVEFRQSVTDLNNQISAAINDVANGFYPSGQAFSCTATPGSSPVLAYMSPPPEQGSNNDCILLGKMLHFTTAGSVTPYLEVISVAGNRLDSTNQPVQKIELSHPTAIIDTVNTPAKYDATAKYSLENGSTFSTVKEYDSSGGLRSNDYGFGIFSNLNSAAAGGGMASGGRTISLYGFDPASSLTSSSATEADASNAIGYLKNSDQIDKAIICLQNGSHQAFITIGGSGKLTTDITWEHPCP